MLKKYIQSVDGWIDEQRVFYGCRRIWSCISCSCKTKVFYLACHLFLCLTNTCSELRTLIGLPWCQLCCSFCAFANENLTNLNVHFIQTIPCNLKFSIQLLNISQFLMNSSSYSLWFFEFCTYSERIWSRQRMLVIWLETSNFGKIVHNL